MQSQGKVHTKREIGRDRARKVQRAQKERLWHIRIVYLYAGST